MSLRPYCAPLVLGYKEWKKIPQYNPIYLIKLFFYFLTFHWGHASEIPSRARLSRNEYATMRLWRRTCLFLILYEIYGMIYIFFVDRIQSASISAMRSSARIAVAESIG